MKTIEEIRDYLLENRVDEDGDLMLDDLDFSTFYGDVYITGMKVKGSLYQDNQKVDGDLFQGSQEVEGDYYCRDVQVKGNIFVNEPTRILQEITTEELAELGYKLKENE